jgi:hypothetical protein
VGMDVFGVAPTTTTGEYFRNNVWWWRGLWQYCCQVAPDLTADVAGQSNDGEGLNAADAVQLATVLREEIASGRCAEFAAEFARWKASFDREPCTWCDGSGIRTDAVGREQGMPTRVLDDATAVLLGRSTGWCNGCSGEGLKDDWRLLYHFSVDNVAEFAEFAENSGGFRIC